MVRILAYPLLNAVAPKEDFQRRTIVSGEPTQDGKKDGSGKLRLSERQRALIDVIQGLDPDLRHTLTIICRGTEPWTVERVAEHMDIGLRLNRNDI
jgi:hypothetical protein